MGIQGHLRTKHLLVERFKSVKAATERVAGVIRIERHPRVMIPAFESTTFLRPSQGDHEGIEILRPLTKPTADIKGESVS